MYISTRSDEYFNTSTLKPSEPRTITNQTIITHVTTAIAQEVTLGPDILDVYRTPIALTLTIIHICGGLLNLMVIVMFLKIRKLRTPTNLLVANLSVSDFLSAALVGPVLLVALGQRKFPGGDTGCKMYAFNFLLLGAVSMVTVAVISMDR